MNRKLYMYFAGSCTFALFAFLSYVVKFYPDWLQPFDNTLTTIVRNLHPHWNGFFLWITQFGGSTTIIILFLVLFLVLIYGKKYVDAIWLSLGVAVVAGGINPLLKLFFTRKRPLLEHLVTETSYSFPSGHATASMVFYGSLIFLVPLFIQTKFWRIGLQTCLAIFILFIGISRIYLGVHFPTDILGGYCESLTWLLFTYPIYRKYRQLRVLQKTNYNAR
ncbi:phospholipid phosphatase [Tetragenococcus osmophilus]|uniref:Phosphatase PAP2 family protein n=1 Tax=Tetragenococcus osmophilus TaxID=526944 RepID=A0AA37XL50_9ENTE|nr:phosphatase PAP2 family protein [Tetragenococcus osmophilus]AYW47590.1 phospholipid phosphatase [Tetragenococcus osmophilus]GMA72812.1 phosphatase PAP2 family protein [Tetragenococcus osmophilus]